MKRGSIIFLIWGKFIHRMVEKGHGHKFEQFLQETKPSARNNRLISFLDDNRVLDRDFGGYRIVETGLEIDKNNRDFKLGTINEVAKFMRDPFGSPYIPGSSLKGAIRTILMNTNPDWNNKSAVDSRGRSPKENKKMIRLGSQKGSRI